MSEDEDQREELKSIVGEQLKRGESSARDALCLRLPQRACPGLGPQGPLTKATLFKMSLRIKASPSHPSRLPCKTILAVPGMF